MVQLIEKMLRRGKAAKTLLEKDVFREAVQQVEKDLLNEWKASRINDIDKREKSYLAVKCLDDIVLRLSGYVNEAEAEQAQAKAKAERDKDGRERKR